GVEAAVALIEGDTGVFVEVETALDQGAERVGGGAAAVGVALRSVEPEQPDGDLASVEVDLEAVAVDDPHRAVVVERAAAGRRRPTGRCKLGLRRGRGERQQQHAHGADEKDVQANAY